MRPLPTSAAVCGIVARPEPTHHTATIATTNNTNSPPFIFALSKNKSFILFIIYWLFLFC
jgi:hypothetical protein